MKDIKIEKPRGTFYSDYTIEKGKCYAIFEHDSRVTTKFVCNTTKTNNDFSGFKVEETDTHFIINLGE